MANGAGGRPTMYNQEIADYICELVASNPCGLQKLCKTHPEIPDLDTIYKWRYKHKEFADQYAQAKLKQADLLAEQIIDISDNDGQDTIIDDQGNERINSEYVARSRLKVDTRKWLAGKLLPRAYGDLQKAQSLESENIEMRNEIKELRKQLDSQNKKDY